MKKTAIILVAVLAVVLSIVCLAACNDPATDGSDTATEGTYKFYSALDGDRTLRIGDTEEDFGGRLTADTVILVLKADGTVDFSMNVDPECHTIRGNGTWEQEGNKIYMTILIAEVNEPFVFTKKGDKLTGFIGDVSFDLKKSR